jgi:hypothetical protein
LTGFEGIFILKKKNKKFSDFGETTEQSVKITHG